MIMEKSNVVKLVKFQLFSISKKHCVFIKGGNGTNTSAESEVPLNTDSTEIVIEDIIDM